MQKTISEPWLRQQLENLNPRAVGKSYSLEDNLFSAGVLDSFVAVGLVSAIEDQLGVVFRFEHFHHGHFRSLHSILELFRTQYGL